MSLIWNEWKKNICNRLLWCAVIAAVVGNIWILYITDEIRLTQQGCDRELYRTTYELLEGHAADEAVAIAEEKSKAAFSGEQAASEYFTYQIILAELQQCRNYPDYLDKIRKEAEQHTQIAIFSENDSYSDRSMQKTVAAYSEMENQILPIGASRGILLITDTVFGDILILILLVLAGIVLIRRDRENGMIALYQSCRNGRKRLAAAKMVSMMIFAIGVTILVVGSSVLFGWLRYGLGDLNRPVQSVYGFDGCSMTMSVIQFLLLYLAAKILLYIMAALVLLVVMAQCDSTHGIYIAISVFLCVEILLYYGLRENSVFMAAKYLNIFAWMNTAHVFDMYRNIRIFHMPCDYRVLSLLLAGVVTVIALMQFVRAFCNRRGDFRKKNSDGKMLFEKGIGDHLAGNELYKIFIYNKNILMIVLAGILIWNMYVPIRSIYSTLDDVYYHMCICETEGPYTEEKKQYVEQMLEHPPEEKLSDWEHYQEGYERLEQRMNRISELENGVIFYERGYELLTGKNIKTELQNAILCIFLVILMVTAIWSVDCSTGMERLIATTVSSKKVECIKGVSALLIGGMTYLATHIPWNYNILHTYGADYLGVSANNLQHLSFMLDGISILGYAVCMHMIKFLVLCAVIFGIRFIARKNRSYLQALLVSTLSFLTPLIICWMIEV